MRIYKITARSNENGRCIDWASCKSKAVKKLKHHNDIGYTEEQVIEPVDVAMTKKGVLCLLLNHCPFHDNG